MNLVLKCLPQLHFIPRSYITVTTPKLSHNLVYKLSADYEKDMPSQASQVAYCTQQLEPPTKFQHVPLIDDVSLCPISLETYFTRFNYSARGYEIPFNGLCDPSLGDMNQKVIQNYCSWYYEYINAKLWTEKQTGGKTTRDALINLFQSKLIYCDTGTRAIADVLVQFCTLISDDPNIISSVAVKLGNPNFLFSSFAAFPPPNIEQKTYM